MLARMAGQEPRRPQLMRIAKIFRFAAGQVTSQAFAAGVITGSLPGRGRSSSAAIGP